MRHFISKFSSEYERDFWVLGAGWFLGAIGFAASIPFLSIYFQETLKMSTAAIGWSFGLMAVLRAGFQAVGGELYDRYGAREILIISQSARAATFVLMGLAVAFDWGFWPLLFLLSINFIFGSIFIPALHALISDLVPTDKKLTGFAIARSAGNLGWFIGPLAGGYLSELSYELMFYASALVSVLSSLTFLLFLTRLSARLDKPEIKLADLVSAFKDKSFAFHCLASFVLILVVAQLVVPLGLYASKSLSMSHSQVGQLLAFNGLLVVLLQVVVANYLKDKPLVVQMIGGGFLYFVGYSLVGWFSSWTLLLAVMVVITMGEVVMAPASMAITSKLATVGHTGRYMGIYGLFVTAGWAIGPLYGGVMLDLFSGQPQIGWPLTASLALVAAIAYFIVRKRFERKLVSAGGTTG